MDGIGVRLLGLLLLWLRLVGSHPSVVLVGEKGEECFYQEATEETDYKVRVFVFRGGSLDIGLSIQGPQDDGESSKRDPRRVNVQAQVSSRNLPENRVSSDGAHEEKFTADVGEYKICLSNDRRFDQAAKHVMLDIVPVPDGTETRTTAQDAPSEGDDSPIQELAKTFHKIAKKQWIGQMEFARRETALQDNHGSMVQSSVVETVVLFVVGVGQIFVVRHWFQGKDTLLKQWT